MTDTTRIDDNRTFSEIARDRHAQYEKQESEGKTLFARGSKFVGKCVEKLNQLLGRQTELSKDVQLFSKAIDHEYQEITIGGKSVSEYVFGDMLADGNTLQPGETGLIALELKVQDALKTAYENALSSNDWDTVELLGDRQRFLDTSYSSAGWREAVVGYHVLRDVVAESLSEEMEIPGDADEDQISETEADQVRQAFFRAEADDLLKGVGGLRLGLNEPSVHKVSAALRARPEFGMKDAGDAVLDLADTLRDKIRMNNSINVTGNHLSNLNDELKGMMDASAPLQKALTENKNLLEELERAKVDGTIFNPGTAKAFSERLNTNALKAFNLRHAHMENSLVRIGGDQHSNTEKDISAMIGELAAGTHDLAKSLLAEGDRNDPQVGFSATEPVGMKSGTLQQDGIKRLFRSDEALGAQLGTVTSLYQSPASQSSAGMAAFGHAINAHNENLILLQYFYNEYSANPSMEKLDDIRGMLDSTLGSYYDLSANLEKTGQSKLQSAGALAEGEADTLQEQGVALQKLSFLVDATKQTMLDGLTENASADLLQLEDDNVDWVKPEQPSRGVSTDSNVSDLFGPPDEDLDGGADDINGPAGPQDEDNGNTGRVRSASEESVEYVNDVIDRSLEPKIPTKRGPDDMQELDLAQGLAEAGAAQASDLTDDAVSVASVIVNDDGDDENAKEVADEMLEDLPDPNEFVARAQRGTPEGPEFGKVGLIDDEVAGVEQGGDADNRAESDNGDTSSSDDTLPPEAVKV